MLVPVFYVNHEHHRVSLDLLVRFGKATGCCGAHTLVEVFSTLTRMPGKYRISADQAMLFIGSIRERLSPVALTAEEYLQALEVSASRGIVGGGIYDALLAQCALKSGASVIYTWNVRHYSLCGDEVTTRLRTP